MIERILRENMEILRLEWDKFCHGEVKACKKASPARSWMDCIPLGEVWEVPTGSTVYIQETVAG